MSHREVARGIVPEWGWVLAGMIFVTAVMFFAWRGPVPQELENGTVRAPWASAAAREAKRRATIGETINGNLDLQAGPGTERRWQSFLSAVKWQADRRPEVLEAVRRQLKLNPLPARSPRAAVETRRLALETAYGLFSKGLEAEMQRIFAEDSDPKNVAMAGAWLGRRADGADGAGEAGRESKAEAAAQRAELKAAVQTRFPDWQNEPRLLALVTEWEQPRAGIIEKRPALADLLRAPFDGRPVVFSFQRVDRRQLGRAVVRHANGKFLLEPDGAPFSVTQFALSASGLPGTLTNGNTPSGIFEITKISTTKNTAIGPTETLILGLPLEYDRSWTTERYQNLLPESWRGWWPMQEAWWAGLAGRNEILAHGTAIDPAPWRDTVFAGQTPSHGCLTCDEAWDPLTGDRVTSEQAELVQAVRLAGGPPGYLVLVEIDGKTTPVTEAEVREIVEKAN